MSDSSATCWRRGGRRSFVRRGQPRLGRPVAILHADLQKAVIRLQMRLRASLLQHYSPSGAEYFIINDDHDGQRYVKGQKGRVDLVAEILADDAVRHAFGDLVLVADDEQRRQTDAGCAQPHQRHAQNHALGGALDAVLEGLGDGVVPVHAYHAQIQYGGGAGQHVERHPQIAHEVAQTPAAEYRVEQSHRHDQNGDAQVGHGQRDEQVVARSAQLLDQEDGQTDEDVADDGDDDDQQHDEAGDDRLDRNGRMSATDDEGRVADAAVVLLVDDQRGHVLG